MIGNLLSSNSIKSLTAFSELNNELIIKKGETDIMSADFMRIGIMKDKLDQTFKKDIRFNDLKGFLTAYKSIGVGSDLKILKDKMILKQPKTSLTYTFYFPKEENMNEWRGASEGKDPYKFKAKLKKKNTVDAVFLPKSILIQLKKFATKLKRPHFGIYNNGKETLFEVFYHIVDKKRKESLPHFFSSVVSSLPSYKHKNIYSTYQKVGYLKNLPNDDYNVFIGLLDYQRAHPERPYKQEVKKVYKGMKGVPVIWFKSVNSKLEYIMATSPITKWSDNLNVQHNKKK